MSAAGAALGIYVHVPFCRTKCRYCDFYRVGENRFKIDLFLAALHREIDGWTALHGRSVETVFLGGGTPSLLSGEEIGGVLRHLAARFAVAADAEITAEANPSDLDPPVLDALRAAGVNRLSIGVQSFSDRELHLVGRRHDAARAERVVREARQAGFENLSIDLMLAIPGQTEAGFRRSLDKAIAIDPERADAYMFRASARRYLEEFARARQDIDKALKLAPTDPDALVERGTIKRLTNDDAGAREDWMQVIRRFPDSAASAAAQANLEKLDVKQ